MVTWLIGLLAPRLGQKAAAVIAKTAAVVIFLTVVIGPYVVIYLKMQSSEKKMTELTVSLALESSKRTTLEADLSTAKQNAALAQQDAAALGKSLDTLNTRYRAAVGRIDKLDQFLAGVNWQERATKDPAGTETLLNDTIKEIWSDAETATGTTPRQH